jgi:hypothetical protein
MSFAQAKAAAQVCAEIEKQRSLPLSSRKLLYYSLPIIPPRVQELRFRFALALLKLIFLFRIRLRRTDHTGKKFSLTRALRVTRYGIF